MDSHRVQLPAIWPFYRCRCSRSRSSTRSPCPSAAARTASSSTGRHLRGRCQRRSYAASLPDLLSRTRAWSSTSSCCFRCCLTSLLRMAQMTCSRCLRRSNGFCWSSPRGSQSWSRCCCPPESCPSCPVPDDYDASLISDASNDTKHSLQAACCVARDDFDVPTRHFPSRFASFRVSTCRADPSWLRYGDRESPSVLFRRDHFHNQLIIFYDLSEQSWLLIQWALHWLQQLE